MYNLLLSSFINWSYFIFIFPRAVEIFVRLNTIQKSFLCKKCKIIMPKYKAAIRLFFRHTSAEKKRSGNVSNFRRRVSWISARRERKWLWQRNNFRHPVPNNRPYAVPNADRMLTPELVVFSRDVKQCSAQHRECNCNQRGGRTRNFRMRQVAVRTPRMHARLLEISWMAISTESNNYENSQIFNITFVSIFHDIWGCKK